MDTDHRSVSQYAEVDLEIRAYRLDHPGSTYREAANAVGPEPPPKPGELPASTRLHLEATQLMSERGLPTDPRHPQFSSKDYLAAWNDVYGRHAAPTRQAEAVLASERQRRLADRPTIARRMDQLMADGVGAKEALREAAREAAR